MADTPDAAAATKAKAGGAKKGKIDKKTGLILAGVGAVGVVWYLSKKKKEGTNATPTADEGLTSQAFIPVTGSEPFGGGGGGGIGGVSSNGSELGQELKENALENREFEREQNSSLQQYLQSSSQQNAEILKTLTSNLTGGGAPTSPGANGTVTAPTSGASSSPAPVTTTGGSSKSTSKGCPSSFPNTGPHGCYKNCTGSSGEQCHCYQNGAHECQHKVGGKWTW